MAKGKNALGKFRGKIGGQVLRVDAGIGQIISEYNPNPRNPRTLAQTKQRNKMNLAGQLSKITPYAAIAGLDSNRRKSRSMFVSNILNTASLTGVDELTAANLSTALKLSKGVFVNATGSAAFGTGQTAVITVTPMAGDVTLLGGLVVAYVAPDGADVQCSVRKMAATDTSVTIPLHRNGPLPAGYHQVVAYYIPIVDTGEDARTAFAALTLTATDFSAVSVRSLAAAAAYGESVNIVNATLEEP